MDTGITRFLEAQNGAYYKALSEIRSGRKQTHWMWFIFPQIEGLGQSDIARFYAIKNRAEAEAFLAHPALRKNLIEISTALLTLDGLSTYDIFGSPDDMKLYSSMTLFANIRNTAPVFSAVLLKYFGGRQDDFTLLKLQSAL